MGQWDERKGHRGSETLLSPRGHAEREADSPGGRAEQGRDAHPEVLGEPQLWDLYIHFQLKASTPGLVVPGNCSWRVCHTCRSLDPGSRALTLQGVLQKEDQTVFWSSPKLSRPAPAPRLWRPKQPGQVFKNTAFQVILTKGPLSFSEALSVYAYCLLRFGAPPKSPKSRQSCVKLQATNCQESSQGCRQHRMAGKHPPWRLTGHHS